MTLFYFLLFFKLHSNTIYFISQEGELTMNLINGICDEKFCKTINIKDGSCIDDLSIINITISAAFNRVINLLIDSGIANFTSKNVKDHVPEFYITKELSNLIIEQGKMKNIGCFQVFDHNKVHNTYIFYNKLIDEEYAKAYDIMNTLANMNKSTVHVSTVTAIYDEIEGEIKFIIPYENTMIESNKHYNELIDTHITIKM